MALGTQYQATDRVTLRAGYLYNTNPIPNPVTLFNVQAPGIITNTLTLGVSYQLTENVTASLAWMHGFRNAIEGPILQIPGSSVRLDAQLDTLWAGVNIKFGGSKRKVPAAVSSDVFASSPPATESNSYVPAPPSNPSGREGLTSSPSAGSGAPTPAVAASPPPAPPLP